MKTIKEIEKKLKSIDEPTLWIEELKDDQRKGVQTALKRWTREYEKRELAKIAYASKLAFDESFAPFKGALVAGVDEAGRGPLAGPVVTAAVILQGEATDLIGLDDSKAISKGLRDQLADKIRGNSIAYSVHIQSADLIDELNIYAATRDSMEKAVEALSVEPDFVIADAMTLETNCQMESVVKADAKSLAVAAASILAKTTRDEIMNELHKKFPAYHFNKNAGYGTAEHVEALNMYGPCEHHRKSFEPVKSLLKERR